MILILNRALSQEVHFCNAHNKEKELWQSHPELAEKYNQFINNVSFSSARSSDTVYTIPIVFHILHEYGNENISDQQVYRQVEIINEDFRKLNADTTDIVATFKPIAADARIEFKLAQIDPFGNCTNGINRYHSPETTIGDDYSKLNQWARGRYLNVWVVKDMENGVAGYAYLPTSTEGDNRFRDGIVIRNNYIGDIGTSSSQFSRTLTHEIGHWLGLAHPWGPTNNPGQPTNCNEDDGIEDTPNTVGWTSCNLEGTTCDTVLDNVQNYMDYSFCSNMFTQGQVNVMLNALKSDVAQRAYLWSPANHELVFNEDGNKHECSPVADFFGPRTACLGEEVTFENFSWRLKEGAVKYTWEFDNANVNSLEDVDATVSFNSLGWQTVRLIVEQDGLFDTIEKKNAIYITPDWAYNDGIIQYDFENGIDGSWIVYNEYNQPRKWELEEGAGKNSSQGIFLDVTNPFEGEIVDFTPEFFYRDRLGGMKYNFILPTQNLANMTDAELSFEYACATNASNLEGINEALVVFVSRNCGETWQRRLTIDGPELINNGSGWDSFKPNETSNWTTASFLLPDNMDENVLIRFEYNASDNSNNIAIDNIAINGLLKLENEQMNPSVVVFPNPINSSSEWNIRVGESFVTHPSFELISMEGKTLAKGVFDKSKVNKLKLANATNGVYILKVYDNSQAINIKLVVE